MVKKRKAARMTEDAMDQDAFSSADPARDAFNRHRNRIQQKLDEKPVGFVVDWGGPQQCLITKDWPSDADRKDEAGRRDLASKLRRIKNLIGFRDEDTVHHWMHYVHERAPWMGPVSAYIMEQVLGRVRHGLNYVNFDPILLHGAPGIGKTHYAKMLAEYAGTPVLVMDGSAMFSAFQIAGVERGWATAGASPVVRFIADMGVANPIVVIDEADKIGSGVGHRAGNPHHALLGMMESVSAKSWRCPYTEVRLDLSRVSWLLTANDTSQIPAPLKDRCRVIQANAPSEADIRSFIRNRMRGHDPLVIQRTVEAAAGMSLRRAGRLVDAVIAAVSRPMLN